MSLLAVREVSKGFSLESGVFRRSTGRIEAVRRVSFEIHDQETVAIVGGSGCGKSTLARLICGLLTPDSGNILWEGRTLGGMSRSQRAHQVQMIFQDPYASLNPKLTIGTQLAEVISMGGESVQTASPLLQSVGLSADALPHYPFQFSGGQRQRIAIARALALHPLLLIADEPLSALDVTVQAQILQLFGSLKKEYGLTLLFITHDLSILPGFADRVLVMQDGVIVESGATESVLHAPAQAYTRSLLDAIPRMTPSPA